MADSTPPKIPPGRRQQFLPFDRIAGPDHGRTETFVDQWWVVDPERGLLFVEQLGRSKFVVPQCNPDERVARMLASRYYPDFEVRQIPAVTVTVDPFGYFYLPQE